MGAFATALIAARGFIPNAWSILIANAVLATAYGPMWWGVRSFEGRNTRVLFAIAGALLWLGACAVPAFYATATARAVLMSAIGVGYTVLAVFELWRVGIGNDLIVIAMHYQDPYRDLLEVIS
jgi:hypothetical protein